MKVKFCFFLFIFCPFLFNEAGAVIASRPRNVSAARAATQSIGALSVQAAESETSIDSESTNVSESEESFNGLSESDVVNKSSSFANIFGGENNINETPLQRSIREQRLKLAASVQTVTTMQALQVASAGVNTAIECDNKLRQCMILKCGDSSFSKCFNDSDTDWGIKINSCRRDTKCTDEEFAELSAEIKADLNQNFELSGFGAAINCGKTYNNCIRDACGNNGYTNCIARGNSPSSCKGFATNYQKCWNKSGGDSAIARCDNEYKKCQTVDSGLVSRTMDFFAGMKVDLEKNISSWEQKLYSLRDSMANMCKNQNAMLDERSLQCVYTVELYADKDGKDTLFASKKLQSDAPYTCSPDWFGIDITTFKENAFRLTRSQTAATSAMMGAGLGVGAGSVVSGAMGRAISTQQAEKDLAAEEAKAKEEEDKKAKEAALEKAKVNEDADKKDKVVPIVSSSTMLDLEQITSGSEDEDLTHSQISNEYIEVASAGGTDFGGYLEVPEGVDKEEDEAKDADEYASNEGEKLGDNDNIAKMNKENYNLADLSYKKADAAYRNLLNIDTPKLREKGRPVAFSTIAITLSDARVNLDLAKEIINATSTEDIGKFNEYIENANGFIKNANAGIITIKEEIDKINGQN